MTSHIGRLYALAIAILVFFLAWTAVAAQPWATTATTAARLKALADRELRVRQESVVVGRIVHQR
jgi:hypothetical protein